MKNLEEKKMLPNKKVGYYFRFNNKKEVERCGNY